MKNDYSNLTDQSTKIWDISILLTIGHFYLALTRTSQSPLSTEKSPEKSPLRYKILVL